MQIIDNRIKPSFFDDDSFENFQIWKKDSHLKKTSEVRILEGLLLTRSSRTNLMKSRYYVLFEDRLACYKTTDDSQEKAYCLIQNMRIEKIANENDKDEKYGIRIIQNFRHCDLYVRSKEQYAQWMTSLSPYGVLSSYSNHFVNMKVIGKGSFAKVYLVKRKSDNNELAVKTFDKNLLLKQEKAKSSLISEINIMRQMKHENIIKLYEVYESDNHIYLVQELLNGGELFDRIIKKGQYSEKDACVLMKKLLGSLAFMHAKGVMHRDIKPENLILKDVENDWNVKIADFGLATYVNPNHDYLFKRCGTPGYVAPEVLADARYDQKVDVFSAGVILYILLTGGSPFYGKSYNEILWKNKVCEITFDFKEKDKGLKVSESATDLLKKMLAKDPARRISAAEALQHDWMLSGGMNSSPSSGSPHYLCSAQENMKRFQEENRFNVKNIKPKDLDKSDLERCVHAPSPLITGKVLSIIDSPDLRKTPGTSRFRFTDTMSPLSSTWSSNIQQYSSPSSTIDENDDLDAISDEHNTILESIGKYRNGYNLITQIKDSSSSTNSSSHNTPVVFMRPMDTQATSKKVMNVQESLLGLVKTQNVQTVEQIKKSDVVKDNLKQFH